MLFGGDGSIIMEDINMGEDGLFLKVSFTRNSDWEVLRMSMLAADVSILAEAGSVIAIGFTVVFLVLILLTGVFKLFGMLMSRNEKDKAEAAPVFRPVAKEVPVAQPAAPIVGNTQQVSSKPDVDGGIPEETVAVISAAVASVAPAGTQYAVKGIRKL